MDGWMGWVVEMRDGGIRVKSQESHSLSNLLTRA